MAGLGSTRNLRTEDLEIALVEKDVDEVNIFSFDEDSSISFDFECEPSVEDLRSKLQQSWNYYRKRRHLMIEEERSFFAKIFAKLHIFVPPNPPPEDVEVADFWRKSSGRYVKLSDADLTNYTENKKVYFTCKGADQDSFIQFYIKYKAESDFSGQPCVNAFKLCRFDFALVFNCPKEIDPELKKLSSSIRHLRAEAVKSFWDVYTAVFGYDNQGVVADHLSEVFEKSPPSWFDFPFHFRIDLDNQSTPIMTSISQKIPEVAKQVKHSVWPRMWRQNPNEAPFTVEAITVRDGKQPACDVTSDEQLMSGAAETTLHFKPRGRSAAEIHAERQDSLDEAPAPSEEKLEPYPFFTYQQKSGSRNYLHVSNIRMSDIWEVLDYVELANDIKENHLDSVQTDREEIRDEINRFIYLAMSLIRYKLRKSMRQVGLVIEEADFPLFEETYMLIGAPNKTLEHRAELLKMRKIVQPRGDGTFVGGFLPSMFLRGGPIQEFWVEDEKNKYLYHPYFRSPYSGDPACVFTHAERARLMSDIIESMKAEPDAQGNVRLEDGGADLNLHELQHENILKDHFCLHDTEVVHLLRKTWANPWRRNPLYFLTGGALRQDLNLIRDYFGERLAFYFAFLGYYSKWMSGPALVGCLIFFLRARSFGRDDWEEEYQILPLFALLVAFWSTTFLEFLKRHLNRKGYCWDVQTYHQTNDPVRPNFVTAMNQKYSEDERAKHLEEAMGLSSFSRLALPKATSEMFSHDVLKQDLRNYNELYYYPRRFQLLQYIINYPFVLCCIIMLFTVMLWIYAGFKFTVEDVGRGSGQVDEDSDDESVTADDLNRNLVLGICNGIAIPAFNVVYKMAALRITELENHRSQMDFDDAVTMKVFAFQFVNSYSTLFFTAFWTQSLPRLSTQLMTILITGQIINNCTELLAPKLLSKYYKILALMTGKEDEHEKSKNEEKDKIQKLREAQANSKTFIEFETKKAKLESFKPNYVNLSEDYLEMIIQFGFVTMFVAAFPLAPVFAFLNNVFEIRIDASKLAYLTRKPFPSSADGIGVWMDLLEFMSFISILCNVLLIGVTSPNRLERDMFDCEDGETRFPCKSEDLVWVMMLLEHLVIGFKMLFRAMIPDVPFDVKLDRFRSEYFLIRENRIYDDELEEGCVEDGAGDDYDDEH
eukprot:Rmarinus@m.17409